MPNVSSGWRAIEGSRNRNLRVAFRTGTARDLQANAVALGDSGKWIVRLKQESSGNCI